MHVRLKCAVTQMHGQEQSYRVGFEKDALRCPDAVLPARIFRAYGTCWVRKQTCMRLRTSHPATNVRLRQARIPPHGRLLRMMRSHDRTGWVARCRSGAVVPHPRCSGLVRIWARRRTGDQGWGDRVRQLGGGGIHRHRLLLVSILVLTHCASCSCFGTGEGCRNRGSSVASHEPED